MKTDAQIQSDVMQELKWDPSVNHEHIGVAVTDGIVTLSGAIPSYIEKSAAEKATQRVAGVKAVVEKIEVKLPGSYKKDDQDLAKTILNQFKWSVQVPDTMVKAKVENGWVDLTGEVEWDYQRNATENCVRGLSGVVGISNNISIKVKKADSAAIKLKIEEALKREAEREARRIAVEVLGDKVILSGAVRSFAEMQDAQLAAWSAPGVTTVQNNLHVS
ncbi:MAG: BON domain-containing protein [Pseudobdellovibrio sp.]